MPSKVFLAMSSHASLFRHMQNVSCCVKSTERTAISHEHTISYHSFPTLTPRGAA
jgi:hypothetical protein